MLGKIEHIGIAVKNLTEAEQTYEKILGTPSYKREGVTSEAVMTSFFMSGSNKIELLAATSEDSVIHKFLEKSGEGIHHIAFEVEDILSEMIRLRDEGFRILQDAPKKGADNKLICFVHPKDTMGVLIELCQEIKDNTGG